MSKRPNVFGSSSDSEDDTTRQVKRRLVKKKLFKPGHESALDTLLTPVMETEDESESDNYQIFPISKSDSIAHSPSINTSLFQSNSNSMGLSIMQKMGFKVGDSLGINNSTTVEPIKVVQRESRSGIGSKKIHPKEEVLITSADLDKFRELTGKQQVEKHTERLYKKLMKVCYEMSGEDNLDVSEVNPLWKPYVLERNQIERAKQMKSKIIQIENDIENENGEEDKRKENEAESINNYLGDEKKDDNFISGEITNLLVYLRSSHNFCYFCGSFYDDAIELQNKCPGVEEIDHK